jgi:hypothetical protein
MHSFMLLATAAAVILAGTATSDGASRKKPQASADRSATVVKHKRHVTRPVAGRPWNQPWQGNQGWPTSVNDGSFSYGIGPGGSFR